MAWTLDLGPLVRLQKRIWRVAMGGGAGVYFETIAILVLLTNHELSPFALPVVGILLAAQLALIYRPARQFAHGDLARRHRAVIVIVPLIVVTVSLASPPGERRAVSAFMATLVGAIGVWAARGAIRVAREFGPRFASVRDHTVLEEALSFSPLEALSTRVRASGDERARWALPFLAGVAAFAGVASTLVLVTQAMGVNVAAAPVYPSTFVAVLVFYIVMRRLKLSAPRLRSHDRRAPVLILRQFGDDFLESGRLSFGAAATFEHFIAGELNRTGPVVAIGRPGEKLQPLGASRDYLEGDDWQRAVGIAIAEAALVVLVLGESESVLWEFRTTIETRGKARTLVIVPPLPDRAELGRRWAKFAVASADLLGAGFPRELPGRTVLGIAFIGDDAIIAVNDERPRGRAMVGVRSRSDYRLLFRLFDSLQHQQLTSAQALDAFLARAMPLVRIESMSIN